MGFHTNKARRAYWKALQENYPESALQAALGTLPPDTARVLRLHFMEGHSFPEIAALMQRSISIIRNHHNRGIYLLHCHFKNQPRNSQSP